MGFERFGKGLKGFRVQGLGSFEGSRVFLRDVGLRAVFYGMRDSAIFCCLGLECFLLLVSALVCFIGTRVGLVEP